MTHNHQGYLFDSNIAIAILDNDHAVVNLVRQAQEEKRRVFFSTVTECEVLCRIKHNQLLIAERLFSPRHTIHVDSTVARKAASMQSEQRNKGRKIKTPDALIVATAFTANLVLVSRDSDMNFATNEYGMTLLKI